MLVLSTAPVSQYGAEETLEGAAVIYLGFNGAFDTVSQSLLCKADEGRLRVKANGSLRWGKASSASPNTAVRLRSD